jgi:hypothetical protein
MKEILMRIMEDNLINRGILIIITLCTIARLIITIVSQIIIQIKTIIHRIFNKTILFFYINFLKNSKIVKE